MVFGKKKIGDYLSDGFHAVTERVSHFANSKFDGLIDKIEYKVMRLQDRAMKKISSGLLIVTSIVFLALSLFYFLKEYTGLSNTLSFFIIGILLLIVGVLIKSTERSYYG